MLKKRFKLAKRKFELATQIRNSVSEKLLRSSPKRDSTTPIIYKRKVLSKLALNIKLNSTENQINDIKIELKEAKEKIKQLKKALHINNIELSKLKSASITYQKNINSLKNKMRFL